MTSTNDLSLEGKLTDEHATLQLGGQLAHALQSGLTCYLVGELGAGKTTFVRGVLSGLGYRGKVKSPTYTLLESYPFPLFIVHHFDLYRFTQREEWDEAGFSDMLCTQSICLIEWPDKAEGLLPPPDLQLTLSLYQVGRHYSLRAFSSAGYTCLQRLSTLIGALS